MRALRFALLVAVLAAQPATAAEWRPLFNGRDLSGWTQSGQERWRVEDGAIVGETGKGDYGWLVTDRQYSDFVLRLRFKLEGKGNSGVQFRSWLDGAKMRGYQADIEPVESDRTGSLYDEHTMQWLLRTTPSPERVLHPDAWNDLEISAIGDHLQVYLNGVKATDLRHGRTRTGIIALQVHPAAPEAPVKVRWKDLRILDLSPPRILHTVYFRWADGIGEADRAAFLQDVRELLGGIETVRSLEIRVPLPASPPTAPASTSSAPSGSAAAQPPTSAPAAPQRQPYDLAVLLGFEDAEGLEVYQKHPRHDEAKRRNRTRLKATWSDDTIISGQLSAISYQ